jgi:hypothetical protein
MKVAIFSPYATVVPHFDTELDIAQKHLDDGDKVEFINCLGSLANCDFNQHRDQERCNQCVGRREMGLELLEPSQRLLSCQSFASTPIQLNDVRLGFESVDELKQYEIENFDIGYAALSSLVSICHNPEPDLIEHRDLIDSFLKSGFQAFNRAKAYLQKKQPDRVYIYNGRFAATRGILRACEAAHIDYFIHERGCNGEHYELVKNHMLHDCDGMEALIRSYWADGEGNPDREKIATQGFLDRANRVESSWHSFVKDQTVGVLPTQWNPAKKNVTFFCSSEDEFAAIGDCWQQSIYGNQSQAIVQIAQSLLKTAPNIQLTLRVHPNEKNVEHSSKTKMLAMDFPNLTIVPPESPIDSYALLKASDIIITFGSSVGIEAAFWERPSILLGSCYYQNLGCVYRPNSHNEVMQLLQQDLPPLPKLGAMMYGFWLQTRGVPHKYFVSEGLFDGKFKGQTLFARPKKKSLAGRFKSKAMKLFSGQQN